MEFPFKDCSNISVNPELNRLTALNLNKAARNTDLLVLLEFFGLNCDTQCILTGIPDCSCMLI